MSATKILWGQLIVVGLIALAFVWAATQWTAWKLGYQPQLGAPWFELRHGLPVYLPPAFFWWWFHFDAYAPRVFVEGAYIAASGGFVSIAAATGMSVWRAREAREATTYGSARFATGREVRAAGMLGDDGPFLGRLGERYLRHDGPEHVLCFAPTRSGKGVGLVVPTLLTWPGSAIVHDIKGENWTLTSGYRARFGRVLRFDPTSADSDAYNPLLEVRRGDYEVRDVQNIADVLVDPEGALEKRNHCEGFRALLSVRKPPMQEPAMGEARYGDLGIEVAASGGSRRLNRLTNGAVCPPRVGAGAAAAVDETAIAAATHDPGGTGTWSGVGQSRVAAARWQVGPCRIMAVDPGLVAVAVAGRVADASV